MALFNLTDISFTPPGSGSGPLAPLLTENKEYARNTYRYPSDLGSSDKAHYIVININVQRNTNFKFEESKDTPTAIANNLAYGKLAAGTTPLNSTLGAAATKVLNTSVAIGNQVGSVLNNQLPSLTKGIKKSDIGQFTAGAGKAVYNEAVSAFKNIEKGSIRAETRTTDTVALYMPDTLAYTHSQNYENIQAGGQALTALAAGGMSAIDALKQGTPAQKGFQLGRNLSPFIANMLAKRAGGLGQIAFSQAYGVVQNPMLEVLYSSPSFRTFRFDFQFYPRSEKEAEEVQNIIQRLRFHQAPEVATNFGNGFFMVPPSEFDISFYYDGQINPNIPKISTCVLESLDVDYAPGGFSAYEVPNQKASIGGTGMPVAIRLSLQFKETEIMTKTSFSGAPIQENRAEVNLISQRNANNIP
jgi:hypothetical protein